MPETWILEHQQLRTADNLAAARKAFNAGFSTGKGDWNYTKTIGNLAFWVDEHKDEYTKPDSYGSSHVHPLGGDGYYGISLHPSGDKSYDARGVFKIKRIGTTGRFYLWVYAIAMHNGKDLGGYQCFPKILSGAAPTFSWVRISEGSNDGYHFASELGRGAVSG